ncbi:hypothetical protein PVAP13_4NG093441 [Panicum virgatum]|uniref:Uncharacterized protein n=1 Tax=Panicum virgatum TaxID=38727 RepID=A0A8T0T3A6_PANVG|nr:hypothetical protein PVAP13_4NG093441 [Panicum virgatum]
MCVGSLVVFAWCRADGEVVASSGFICGDGMWTFPSSLLSLAKPPTFERHSLRRRPETTGVAAGDDGGGARRGRRQTRPAA